MWGKNKIIITAVGILLIFGTVKGTITHYKNQIKSYKNELKNEKIKNSKLEVVQEGLYSKLIADTLKVKQLKRKVDSLNLKVNSPKLVASVILKNKDIQTKVEDVKIDKDSIAYIKDYYPNKNNPFITYSLTFNKVSNEGVGTFTFQEQEINLGIGQNKDGIFTLNTKVPDYIKITNLDVQALPITPTKIDNFGLLLGASLGKNLESNELYARVNSAIRIKKTYYNISAGTNGNVDIGINIEF